MFTKHFLADRLFIARCDAAAVEFSVANQSVPYSHSNRELASHNPRSLRGCGCSYSSSGTGIILLLDFTAVTDLRYLSTATRPMQHLINKGIPRFSTIHSQIWPCMLSYWSHSRNLPGSVMIRVTIVHIYLSFSY